MNFRQTLSSDLFTMLVFPDRHAGLHMGFGDQLIGAWILEMHLLAVWLHSIASVPYSVSGDKTSLSCKVFLLLVQWLSCVWLFATPWIAAHQASLSFTIFQSLLKFMSIESVMPSNHLILCHPLLLLPSIFPSMCVYVSRSVMSSYLISHGLQHTRLPCPSPSPGPCSNSCPLISDRIQPSHPLLFPSPPAFNLSHHQGIFQWVDSSHQVTRVLELQL